MLLLANDRKVTQMAVGILGHYFDSPQDVLAEVGEQTLVRCLLEYAVRIVVLRGVEQVA